MKKIFYLIPLFLLFFMPKVYALPNCSLVSSATLYDVNSASSVSSISTYKEEGLLCSTIHSAYATSNSSYGLGWDIDLSSLNNENSYYQLDVFMYSSNDSDHASIKNSSFRNNYIAVGTSNASTLWKNGTTNVSDLNYSYSSYYDSNYGRTYDVISYVFKSKVNFNKIFIPFATYNLWTGYFDLVGISLTNTGQSSLTDTEINNLLTNQTNSLKSDINDLQNNIDGSINDMNNSINETLNDNFNNCYKNLFNITNYNDINIIANGGASFNKSNNSITFTTSGTSNSSGFYIPKANMSTYIDSFNVDNIYTFSFDVTTDEDLVFEYGSSTRNISTIKAGTTRLNVNTLLLNTRFVFYSKTLNINNITISNIMVSDKNYTSYLSYGKEKCVNKIDETNDKLNDVNNSINDLNSSINNSDSSGATDSAGNFFNNFEDNDFGLSGIITAPLNTIKTITSNSCTPINLTIPFVNKNMSLPCMTEIYEEHFGSFLDIYHIITFGMISYWVCVQIYAMVKGFKNPDKDEIEVMDL